MTLESLAKQLLTNTVDLWIEIDSDGSSEEIVIDLSVKLFELSEDDKNALEDLLPELEDRARPTSECIDVVMQYLDASHYFED